MTMSNEPKTEMIRLTWEQCQKCGQTKYVVSRDEICPKCKGMKPYKKDK